MNDNLDLIKLSYSNMRRVLLEFGGDAIGWTYFIEEEEYLIESIDHKTHENDFFITFSLRHPLHYGVIERVLAPWSDRLPTACIK